MDFGVSPLPLEHLVFHQQASCSIQAASWASAHLQSRGQKTCLQGFHTIKEEKTQKNHRPLCNSPQPLQLKCSQLYFSDAYKILALGSPKGHWERIPPPLESACPHENKTPLSPLFSSFRSRQS